MKISKLIIILILLVISILAFKSISIETKELSDYIENDNLGFIPSVKAIDNYIRHDKNEKLINASLIAGVLLAVLIFVYFFFKRREDRKDPLIMIKALKEKSIINDNEYMQKKNEITELIFKNKKAAEEEINKKSIIEKLDYLKNNGLLTEDEYKEKINLL